MRYPLLCNRAKNARLTVMSVMIFVNLGRIGGTDSIREGKTAKDKIGKECEGA
jgi:hypothetical protein